MLVHAMDLETYVCAHASAQATACAQHPARDQF